MLQGKNVKLDAEDLESILRVVEETVSFNDIYPEDFLQKLSTCVPGAPRWLTVEVDQAVQQLMAKPKTKRGKLLVVTGIDKAGKETHCFNPEHCPGITSLSDTLSSKGFELMKVVQPSYETRLGQLVATYLHKHSVPVTIRGTVSRNVAWILWSLDRGQHVQRVGEWLSMSERRAVLAKRWFESNLVYQLANGLDGRRIMKLERNAPKPDLTIILDVPVEMVFERIRRSKERGDSYEAGEFLRKVRQLYLNLPSIYPYGEFYIVDANRKAEEVNSDLNILVGQLHT